MKVVSLVDNVSSCALAEHGLSLYVRLDCGMTVLFDMGQGTLFLENARRLGCDMEEVDVAVVSHGHYDHGGGLRSFLEANRKADVFIRETAFEDHFSLKEYGLEYIGLDKSLKDNPRLKFCPDICEILPGITVFSTRTASFPEPEGNGLLYGPADGVRDDFYHEQSLIIKEGNKTVLFAGCAHGGIVNIIEAAGEVAGRPVTHVFAGMHLSKGNPDGGYMSKLASELMSFPIKKFHTMHCTGWNNYILMKEFMGDRLSYLACGGQLVF